jgi:hypothetical protein
LFYRRKRIDSTLSCYKGHMGGLASYAERADLGYYA